MQLVTRLIEIIRQYDLLQHKFYQAWSAGTLPKKTLQNYAAQYYKSQVAPFPTFISRLHSHCPEITVRKVLLANLVDEELHGTDHPTLWMQFANGLGIDATDIANTTYFPESIALQETFYGLAERDWRDGLCALYAYEYQVPEVAASKIAGLKNFYGITDPYILEFFIAHQTYDVNHAQQIAILLEKHANQQQAEKATEQAAQALWAFLDGMCKAMPIHC